MENLHQIKTLFQANAITRSRKEYTALEKNLIYMVLSQLKEGDNNKYYYISIKDIIEKTGVNSRYYEYKNAARSMLKKTINIPKEYSKTGNEIDINFFASCEYMEGQGVIEVELSDKMKPYLFDLKKNFTTFQLDLALSVKSRFTKDLYELLSQYKDTGFLNIKIKELKYILGLFDPKTGKEQFEKWSSFKTDVLNKAKAEFNDTTNNSDIKFSYKANKLGRKFDNINFYIDYKPYQMKIDYKDVDTIIFSKLVNKYKLSKSQSQKVIDNYSEKEINQRLYDISVLKVNNQIKTSIGAYTARIFNV